MHLMCVYDSINHIFEANTRLVLASSILDMHLIETTRFVLLIQKQ